MDKHELSGSMYTVTPSGKGKPTPPKPKPRVVDYLAGATREQLETLPDSWRPPGIPHRHVPPPFEPATPEERDDKGLASVSFSSTGVGLGDGFHLLADRLCHVIRDTIPSGLEAFDACEEAGKVWVVEG